MATAFLTTSSKSRQKWQGDECRYVWPELLDADFFKPGPRARNSSSQQSLMLPVSNGRTFHLKQYWQWFHPQCKHWVHLSFPYTITEVKKVGWVEGIWHGVMSNPAPCIKQVAFPFSVCIWSHSWWLHFQQRHFFNVLSTADMYFIGILSCPQMYQNRYLVLPKFHFTST